MAKRRPSGEGAIRKRKDGRWEGRIVVGHKSDNKPIYKSVFAKTQKELLPKLHKLIDEYSNIDLTEDSNIQLAKWFDIWLEKYVKPTVKTSTYSNYKNSLRYARPYLGEKMLRQITTADIQKMYNSVKANGRIKSNSASETTLSDSTIRSIHMVLHQCMDSAVKNRMISKNPTDGTTIPKRNYKQKQILDDVQLDRFTEVINKYPEWHDFFYTEITTGLRRGEICGLKWSDLDFEIGVIKISRSITIETGGKVVVGEPKTETGKRKILLPPSTLHILKKRRETALGKWIFPNPLKPENPVSPNVAYRKLKQILKKANLPDIRFHDLRHTFATHAIANGVDAKTLSNILGHTNASFTLDTYTHITTDMQQNASDIVGSFMEDIFGKELKPWQKENVKTELAP